MNIGQSIQDFENWRDSQHDLPQPDSLPDEVTTVQYSHDYEDDTTLEYIRSGNDSTLRLSFTSEDPDMGTEELTYHGDGGESMETLVSDLSSEIKAYLDLQDSGSFYQQQGLANEIRSEVDFYGEYSRTALYAFEALMKEIQYEKNPPVIWAAIEPEKKDWLYSSRTEADVERGCIGHLRGDFGRDGTEFWTSWFDHQPELKKSEFREELQEVVNAMRKNGGLLHDFASMRKQCGDGLSMDGSYGFRAETKNYEYCLRCTPRRGEYHFYLYCYSKEAQREHAKEKPSLREQLKTEAVKPTTPKQQMKKEMER